MEKIGIIGNGFVGNAISEGLKRNFDVYVYDKDPQKCQNTLSQINGCEIIFVSVPTPSDEEGVIDISIILDAVSCLNSGKIIIVKSTITPDKAEELIHFFPNQSFVFNPEFLTERTAVEDFKNPKRIVLGGDVEKVKRIKAIYEKVFPDVKYICTDHKTACFIKYFCNCFFAAKVSIINEFKQISDAENIDWPTAIDGLISSGWVNPQHTMVPGPDGDRGFGGKCFPKDINAFINYSKQCGVEPLMLSSAWEKNLKIRKNLNWLKIPGAIIKNLK
jgi:UDPglucose 6-dehydrogenase